MYGIWRGIDAYEQRAVKTRLTRRGGEFEEYAIVVGGG